MATLYGIFGAGGCGRSLMPVARDQMGSEAGKLVFVDEQHAGSEINGHRVLNLEAFIQHAEGQGKLAIAVAAPEVRRRIVSRCESLGLEFFEIRAINAVVMDDVVIGEGALISPFTCFASNVVVGRHFHANLYSYVEHDCVIGDFVTFAPGVRCNGNIRIEDGCYIGSGATIKQGTSKSPLVIGAGAVVGMGAVVTRSVEAGSTVAGNPARILGS
jgi:sugar O-acyltransferase (sialic acid O-acetyltransferase NeuD family)